MKKRIVFFALIGIMVLSITRSALACKGSQVLFQDSFAALDPAWGSPSQNVSVKDGKLILQPEVNRSFSDINQGSVFEDMDACVKVSMAKSDDLSSGGGIIFWAKDYGDYYFLYVTGNGMFEIGRWVGGRYLFPVSLRENSAIKKGVGEVNQLRIVTKGDQATAYINDTELITFRGQPPQGGGLIGLRGDSPEKSQAVWEFSDLKITK